MTSHSQSFRKALQSFGFSDPMINAVWPDWWTNEAETSSSSLNELKFSVSRKLGLDPRSWEDPKAPNFIWHEAKFKHFSGDNEYERALISSFGTSFASALLRATKTSLDLSSLGLSAQKIRELILKRNPFVSLKELLSLCWGLGIPVVHIKIFPLEQKRMAAMTANVQGRYAIIVGWEAKYPAQIAYYVAHELGHILLSHLQDGSTIVELDDISNPENLDNDSEEDAADKFALELLTGHKDFEATTNAKKFSAKELADLARKISLEKNIEPGTLALCLAHGTAGSWPTVMNALKLIYHMAEPVSDTINNTAHTQMDFSLLTDEFSSYVKLVMGS